MAEITELVERATLAVNLCSDFESKLTKRAYETVCDPHTMPALEWMGESVMGLLEKTNAVNADELTMLELTQLMHLMDLVVRASEILRHVRHLLSAFV